MATLYLITCVLLAVSLSASSRWARMAGTLTAAAALFMISLSIILANFDGTFAAFQSHGVLDRSKPVVLNLQACVGLVASLFLLWAAWAQMRRVTVAPTAIRNTASGFGLASRYAHWTTAALMFLLVPMGLFIAVLPDSGDRASLLAVHQALGLTVLAIVVARVAWLIVSPPPTANDELQRRLAIAVHVGLYALIIAFPLSGYLMSAPGNEAVVFYGLVLPHIGLRGAPQWRTLHDLFLPLAFYTVIALHITAVVKHHFGDRRLGDVRRMLR